ncbi:MAG TPA: hypothetical protein VGF66_00015 [Gaiellaceae bacterium]|jgi:hypothetical protein
MTNDTTLTRLRAANPVADASTIDDEALFERIVELPTETARRRPRRKPRMLVLVAATFVAAVAASTAYALTHWVFPDVVHAPVSRAEYERAQTILELPPGYTWPAIDFRADTVMLRGGGGSMAVSIDQSAWECYWAGAIHRGDAAAATHAHAVLDDLMKNRISIAPQGAPENWGPTNATFPWLVYADDGGYQYKQRIYAEAAAGKPAGLEQSCRANGP